MKRFQFGGLHEKALCFYNISGSAKIQGRAKQTAKEIADQLEIRFKEEGWIQ